METIMTTHVTDYIATNFTANRGYGLNSILRSLEGIYLDYDTGILEGLIADESLDNGQIADLVASAIHTDARNVLLIHGIVLHEEASTQTLDLLLQFVDRIDAIDDKEDTLALLNSNDMPSAIVDIAYQTCTYSDDFQGYNVLLALAEIERIESFLVDRLKVLIETGEPAEDTLSPEVTAFIAAHPDNPISELLSPPSALFTGGTVDLYLKLFDPIIREMNIDSVSEMLACILLISNVPKDSYASTLSEVIETYYEPHEHIAVQLKVQRLLATV